MAKLKKTNAMRILEQHKIPYEVYTYAIADGKIDGISAAQKVGKTVEEVYKTLIVQGQSKSLYVFVIPVAQELDLKKAARTASEKKVEMIPVKDLLKHTGYIRGGCSPIGMKKLYQTFIDHSANQLETMTVSGGKQGLQIELKVDLLCELVNAQMVDLTKE